MTQFMNGFPPIDNDTELLIHESNAYIYKFLDMTTRYRIIYSKETRLFTLLQLRVNIGIYANKGVFDSFETQILRSENKLCVQNCFDVTCLVWKTFEDDNLCLLPRVSIKQHHHPETYELVLQLYNNGFQHPLVDEFEGVGVFK